MKRFVWIVALFIGGCTFNAWYGDFDKPKSLFNPPPFHRISIENSKAQVESALGPPALVVGSKGFPDGVVEVWEYQQWQAVPGPDRISERYWVYFFDGKVVQWGRPGDWEREADRIYEIRVK